MDNNVSSEHACPKCGERDADNLVWIDDDRVKCGSCGRVYSPEGNDFVMGIALSRNGKKGGNSLA
jgi:rubredoxin